MKKTILLAAAVLFVGGASAQKFNLKKAISAGASAVKAVTLTDADVAKLCRDAIVVMDAENPVAAPDSEYAKRLARLTKGVAEVDGLPLNFKVYEVTDVNAFASGDGSVRVFAGLMDVMDDDQLMAIIGHEIGHVAGTDVRDAMRSAYLAQAARGAISSTGGRVAKLTEGQLGDLAVAFQGAQFSQKQEFAADEYGMRFCVAQGFDKYGMASSLDKLVELADAGGTRASAVQKMFSSHPDSAIRAARIRKMADADLSSRASD